MRRRLRPLHVALDTRPEPGRRQARFPPPIYAGDRAAQDKGEGACREHEPKAHALYRGILRASGQRRNRRV